MTRVELSEYAESLILDAEDMRDRIEAKTPERRPLAVAVVADAIEAFNIITTSDMGPRARMRICALLVRANVNAEALSRPLQ